MIKDGQNIYDFCISETGSINNLFNILELNNLDIDSQIVSGMELIIPDVLNEKEIYTITTLSEEFNIKIVSDNQNIYDLTTMYFGTMDYLFLLLKNNNFGINQKIYSGTELVLNNKNIGDEIIKNMVIKNNIIFCNYGDMRFGNIIDGDYNDDYDTDNDYY